MAKLTASDDEGFVVGLQLIMVAARVCAAVCSANLHTCVPTLALLLRLSIAETLRVRQEDRVGSRALGSLSTIGPGTAAAELVRRRQLDAVCGALP